MESVHRRACAIGVVCFGREMEPLLRMGLIKGGDLQNALVIYETPMSQEGLDYITDKLGQPRLDANKLGYLSSLNYPNEPAQQDCGGKVKSERGKHAVVTGRYGECMGW